MYKRLRSNWPRDGHYRKSDSSATNKKKKIGNVNKSRGRARYFVPRWIKVNNNEITNRHTCKGPGLGFLNINGINYPVHAPQSVTLSATSFVVILLQTLEDGLSVVCFSPPSGLLVTVNSDSASIRSSIKYLDCNTALVLSLSKYLDCGYVGNVFCNLHYD